MVCNRCQKRPAIIFVQRMENGQMKNEGFCLHCARELHIKPVEDLMKQFGMSDEDMDNMENRMESMMDEMGDANPLSLMMNMGQLMDGEENEGDDDLVPGSSATFPLGVKAEGDAGNERHICKANPAMIDDIGKKHGLEDTSENFSGKKYALAPKAATKFLKASRCYVALGKARRVLWWLGLLLLSPALILWAEWGANGDDDTIICRVLTFSSSSCMNLTTATEYVRRLTLVLIMGVVCWIAALVIFGVRSYMRSVYPELRDHSSSASHVLVGIISFLVLVMVFPVLVITLLSALMTL